MTKFTLEKIDQENVKKTDIREDVSTVNIPALEQQKKELEQQITAMQKQLDQINEVLVEYKKLPQT